MQNLSFHWCQEKQDCLNSDAIHLLTFLKCDLHDDAVFWTRARAFAAISLFKPCEDRRCPTGIGIGWAGAAEKVGSLNGC